MKHEMYMFAVILMIMTIISILGGAVRYEENFYNEVFDLIDDNGFQGDNQNDLANNAEFLPQNNDESLINEESVPSMNVQEEVQEDEMRQMKVQEEQEEIFQNSFQNTDIIGRNIEAYEEGMYSSF